MKGESSLCFYSFFFVCLFVCFVLLCFVLFCFALLCFALLCFALLCFVLLCFVLFCFVCVNGILHFKKEMYKSLKRYQRKTLFVVDVSTDWQKVADQTACCMEGNSDTFTSSGMCSVPISKLPRILSQSIHQIPT